MMLARLPWKRKGWQRVKGVQSTPKDGGPSLKSFCPSHASQLDELGGVTSHGLTKTQSKPWMRKRKLDPATCSWGASFGAGPKYGVGRAMSDAIV
jgi:hypothetical protein